MNFSVNYGNVFLMAGLEVIGYMTLEDFEKLFGFRALSQLRRDWAKR